MDAPCVQLLCERIYHFQLENESNSDFIFCNSSKEDCNLDSAWVQPACPASNYFLKLASFSSPRLNSSYNNEGKSVSVKQTLGPLPRLLIGRGSRLRHQPKSEYKEPRASKDRHVDQRDQDQAREARQHHRKGLPCWAGEPGKG